MKEVVLIGASGFVGTAILNELLNRNYKVTAVVRNPEKMSVKNPALTVVKADVSDVKAIAAICAGKEAVISAYNPGWTNPNIYEDTLKNYPLILEAVKRSGAKRFLCVGGAGTLFCAPGLRVVDSGAIPAEIMGGVKSLGMFYLGHIDEGKRAGLDLLLACRITRTRTAHGEIPPRLERSDRG
jgi:putative NADH-flavin reductase